jgi:Cu/Zn superoxide dismutase
MQLNVLSPYPIFPRTYVTKDKQCSPLALIVAVVRGDSNVKGTVYFEQKDEHSETTITYDISGNDPNAERGMHVHQFGDNTNGCTSAGPHCV